MTDVHRPPTLTLRSRTGAAKSQHFGQLWTPAISPFLVSFTKPKQFHLVRNKLFPTMCLVWKSEEQRFGGCSKSSTSGGRSLYGPVFGMCAAGLATHLTTPAAVCPVARTQTIILQVVYWNYDLKNHYALHAICRRTDTMPSGTGEHVSAQVHINEKKNWAEFLPIVYNTSEIHKLQHCYSIRAQRSKCTRISVFLRAVVCTL